MKALKGIFCFIGVLLAAILIVLAIPIAVSLDAKQVQENSKKDFDDGWRAATKYMSDKQSLDPNGIEQISYLSKRENMLQLLWPSGSSDMLPWGSVLEVDFDDGNGGYFTNVCNMSPIFDRLMCRMYGIGGIDGFDLQNRSYYTIRVVDTRAYPHSGG